MKTYVSCAFVFQMSKKGISCLWRSVEKSCHLEDCPIFPRDYLLEETDLLYTFLQSLDFIDYINIVSINTLLSDFFIFTVGFDSLLMF